MIKELNPEAQARFEEMSASEQLFVRHYYGAANFSATKAYQMLRPDVKQKSAMNGGMRLMRTKRVRAFFAAAGQFVYDETVADLEECLVEITTMIRDSRLTPQERMKALDMRMRSLGAYVDRVETAGEMNIVINVEADGEDD